MSHVTAAVKRILLALCAALPCACKPQAARVAGCPGTVTQVTYEQRSGPVADPHTERYTIALDGVRFERSGEEGGRVNRGTWDVPAPPGSVAALFSALAVVDCRAVREVAPESPVDGGGEEIFRIAYQAGGRLEVWFREGNRYDGAEGISGPVREFVGGLELPREASALLLTP